MIDKIINKLSKITWLNLNNKYVCTQAALHIFLTCSMVFVFNLFTSPYWVAIYPLYKEFIIDKHYNVFNEDREAKIDLLTDLITNYSGYVIGILVLSIM